MAEQLANLSARQDTPNRESSVTINYNSEAINNAMAGLGYPTNVPFVCPAKYQDRAISKIEITNASNAYAYNYTYPGSPSWGTWLDMANAKGLITYPVYAQNIGHCSADIVLTFRD